MFVSELETFVQKFHQLWRAGHSAHLDLDTHAGRAWVGLRVQLGHSPGHLHHQVGPPPFQKTHKKKDNPSRQRRRERRAAARQANAEEVAQKETTEDAEQATGLSDDIENHHNVLTVQGESEKEAEQASKEKVENKDDTTNTKNTVVEETSDTNCSVNEKEKVVLDDDESVSKQFECGWCEEDCMNEINLEKHCFMYHKDQFEVWEYECEVCEEYFKTASLLRRHTKSKHK